MNIRTATAADVSAITQIYNHAVLHSTATFDMEPKSEANRAEWLTQHNDRYPCLVSTIDNKVVGFVSLTQWSTKEAYAGTAELSLYVDTDYRGRGIANQLLKQILRKAKEAKLLNVTSRITSENETSIHLHKKFDFEFMGNHKRSGIKFGKTLDVFFYQYLPV